MMRFIKDSRGAGAAEFALVLPAALLLLFGVIDVGRYAWQLNEYEKAVQLGARYAVATDIVPGALNSGSFAGQTCNGVAIVAGDTICAEAMQTITCDDTSCSCSGGSGLCYNGNYNAAAFDAIVTRMRVATPRLHDTDVTISYAGSGLGYVADPAVDDDDQPLADVAPIVTVTLTNMRYQPITLTLVGVNVPYPSFSYSLSLEDGDGAIAS